MTTVYFVRHAEPVHSEPVELKRNLTEQGMKDTAEVVNYFKDKKIDVFYCSTYPRSIQTIQSTADYFRQEINLDERLRERMNGSHNNHGLETITRRWKDFNYCETGGECLSQLQQRNIEALHEMLGNHDGETIVIGTHGAALSSILNYYDSSFDLDDFMRILDWMPYIIRMEFEGIKLISKHEEFYIERPYHLPKYRSSNKGFQ